MLGRVAVLGVAALFVLMGYSGVSATPEDHTDAVVRGTAGIQILSAVTAMVLIRQWSRTLSALAISVLAGAVWVAISALTVG